jgi:hypothetical protein
MDVNELIDQRHGLPAYRYVFSSELDLQNGIEKVLAEIGVSFLREHRLSPTDRPDFYLPAEGIVIEVKIKGATSNVIRQLNRYAEHGFVKSIVLVTSRMRHQAPTQLNGKQILTINLSSL